MADDQREGLRMAGIIHDLGKIAVPAEILSKPTQLTEIEFKLIKVHPQVGYEILKNIDFPWPIAEIVLQHHERMNGSGYPQGLKGEEISWKPGSLWWPTWWRPWPLTVPIGRPWGSRPPWRRSRRIKGILYDSRVVEVCLGLFREKGFGFE